MAISNPTYSYLHTRKGNRMYILNRTYVRIRLDVATLYLASSIHPTRGQLLQGLAARTLARVQPLQARLLSRLRGSLARLDPRRQVAISNYSNNKNIAHTTPMGIINSDISRNTGREFPNLALLRVRSQVFSISKCRRTGIPSEHSHRA
jgi:hypothetical protein